MRLPTSILAPAVWLKQAATLGHAFRGAIRLVYPSLPFGPLRVAVLDDGSVFVIDDGGDGRVHRVNPLAICREMRRQVRFRRWWEPLLVWWAIPLFTVRVFHRIKRDGAGEAAKGGLKRVRHGDFDGKHEPTARRCKPGGDQHEN